MSDQGFKRDFFDDEDDSNASGGVHQGLIKNEPAEVLKWEEKTLPSYANLAIAHKVVIKNRSIKETQPTNIKPVIPALESAEALKVTPIIEDEGVVGLKIKCECGNEHEIRFEYDL